MKIAVLHGQMHKGSTYNITKLFLDRLSKDALEINEFYMPQNSPDFCVGCFNCFLKGEDHCPHAKIVQPIVKAIEEADLIILNSPCYVCGMSGQLKTFLDHMAYLWMVHRPNPKMFSKTGLVISTAAGAGAKKVTKDIKDNLFYWGIPKIYRFSKNVGALSWETVNTKRKLNIEKEIDKISDRILKNIGKTKPGIKTKLMFKIMSLSQKSNNWNPLDKQYWDKNGWLNGKKPW